MASIESLVGQMIKHGDFDLSFAIRRFQPADTGEAPSEAAEFVVEFSGSDSDLLLERNADLLNAFEHVVLKAARLEEELFGKVVFDCADWRRQRSDELRLMAQVAAERAIETGSSVRLGPMNPRERRIIHLALKDQAGVSTASEGIGADRRVVIMPAGAASKS